MNPAIIGNWSDDDIASYLVEIGDLEAAQRFAAARGRGQRMKIPFIQDVWGYTGSKVGFIPAGIATGKANIQSATTMAPDEALRCCALKITLDVFYVHSYPGRGKHRILCDFTGKNQAGTEQEGMQFALTVSANDQALAARNSLPIFVGVRVGNEGICFEGKTVNVCSSDDEVMLDALGNPAFKEGLSLLTTAQPVLKPFVGLAQGIVKSVGERSKNAEVFEFGLGLDFSDVQTSAKLRLGSYVVVQTDQADWNWADYEWDADSGEVRPKDKSKNRLELNYMVFGVSKVSA
ncbi:MAG: hypothetical protein ACU0A8_05695 [Limimaricola soesokkakensis]|uniref:hypothetical protein n=1 Tax=Limimaricola soesokkakensis TaxID=1343159 RepID=UPI00405A0DBC